MKVTNKKTEQAGHDDIRREILQSALVGQRQSDLTQAELVRQGTKLRETIDRAKSVAYNDTNRFRQAVDELEREAILTKRSKSSLCFHYLCCSGCCRQRYQTTTTGEVARGESELIPIAPRSPSRAQESVSVVDETGSRGGETDQAEDVASERAGESILERARRLINETDVGKDWRRTVAAPLGSMRKERDSTSNYTWVRQVDSSLSQLQRVNEEIGQVLDDQLALAQMLTVYLNHGVDQAIGIDGKLNNANKHLA